jgi:DnaK suppressor protein
MSVTAPTRVLAGVDDGFFATQRSQLISLRALYRQQADELSVTAAELIDDGSPVDMVDDEGFGEARTAEAERERVLALASIITGRLEEIDVALARLQAGAYGTCAGCRQPIDRARLEAVPEATFCVRCKSGTALRR